MSAAVGAAAGFTVTRKNANYNELLATHLFVPLALKSMGPINSSDLDFVKDLGQRVALITGDQMETCNPFHRIAVTSGAARAWRLREKYERRNRDLEAGVPNRTCTSGKLQAPKARAAISEGKKPLTIKGTLGPETYAILKFSCQLECILGSC